MAEKVLKTKVALLYKSIAEWDAIQDTYKPLKGEVCFCEIPVSSEDKGSVLFKVGNGRDVFRDLPWTSALAADVFEWAKKQNLEFSDLSSEFKQDLLDFVGGGGEATQYRLAEDDNGVVKLQKLVESSEGSSWVDVEGSAPIDLGNIEAELNILDENLQTEIDRAKEAESALDEKFVNLAAKDVTFDSTGTGSSESAPMQADNVQAAIAEAWNAIGTGGTGSAVAVKKLVTPNPGAEVSYRVTQGGREVGDDIDIPEVEIPELPHVPQIINNDLYANGVAIRITAGANNKNIVHYSMDHNQEKTLSFDQGRNVYGGGYGVDDTFASYDSSNIIMDSGVVHSIFGGSYHNGSIGVANITVNGGTIQDGVIGGGLAGVEGIINTVGEANIVFNGGTSLTVYGGAHGNGSVGKANLTVNGGIARWTTLGGSNGETAQGKAIINGGQFDVFQVVNRGRIEDAEVIINGGTIGNAYAGGETGDPNVNGKVEKVNLQVLGGTLTLHRGTYNGSEEAAGWKDRISGDYNTGVISEEEAAACNLSENCLILNCNL